jgi:tetratricopeptide (TPR) repeat protein
MWTPAGQRVSRDPKFGPVRAGVDPGLYHGHTKGNSLYRNSGDGKFEYKGSEEHVEMGRWAWSGDGYDFDLDGTPEIYVTAGMITHNPDKDLMSFFWRQVVNHSPAKLVPSAPYENGWNTINELIREDWSWNGNEPNVFYVREGGRYRDYSGVSGLDAALDSRAFAVTDLDGDGYPDLLLKSRLGPQLLAFRNDSAKTANRIAVELRGTKSNRDAIGARVEVASKSGSAVRWVSGGSGYISQHTKRLFFGLGDSATAARLSIHWPSGLQQHFEALEAGHLYRITETVEAYEKEPLLPRPRYEPSGRTAGVNDLVFEPAWLIEPLPAPEPRNGAGLLCLTDGKLSSIPQGVPLQMIDLRQTHPDTAAVWSLFRRYVFDYRAPLTLPLVLLQDERGMVHKVYPYVPDAASLRQDLKQMQSLDRDRLALPFPGKYYSRPSRNYFRSGAPFLAAGYPGHAMPYLSEALRRQPGNFKVRLTIGQVHLEAGRLKEAEEHLSLAAGLNSQSAELWNNLGGLEMARQNYGRALECFEKALAINPDLSYVLANAGQTHARLGNAVDAERAFRRALELSPKDADAANQLGLLLARQDRSSEAAQFLKLAIEIKPDHAAAINNLAVLYIRMRKIDDAIAAFRYGMEVAPDYDGLYMNLARVFTDMNQAEDARRVLEQLLERKPGHREAQAALVRLGGPR